MIKIMITLWLMMVCLTTNFYGLSIATSGEPSGPVEPAPLITLSPCVYQGVIYPEGKFQPDPCTECACTIMGEPVCMARLCALPACKYPVREEGKCCPVCPKKVSFWGTEVSRVGPPLVYYPELPPTPPPVTSESQADQRRRRRRRRRSIWRLIRTQARANSKK